MATVAEVRKRKKKLTEELGPERVAQIEQVEAPVHQKAGGTIEGKPQKLSPQEIRTLATAPTTSKGIKRLSQEQRKGEITTTPEQEAAILEQARQFQRIEELSSPEAQEFQENQKIAKEALSDVEEQEGTIQGIIPREIRTTARAGGIIVKQGLQEGLSAGFNFLIDNIRSITSAKKSLTQSDAESMFMGALGNINEYSAAVARGDASSVDFVRNIKNMRNAVGQLESYEKGKAKLSAYYWATKGRPLKEQILEFKRNLYDAEVAALQAVGGIR